MQAGVEAQAAPTPLTVTIHLQKIPFLAGVDEAALKLVEAALVVKKVERGHRVLEKGDTGEHLFFLLAGRLQVVDLHEDGREIGLNFLAPGDYFGELSIIDGLPRSATVLACENSLIGLLPRAQALGLIYHNPLLVERMLKRMCTSIRNATNYRAIVGIPQAFQRVFTLLNQFAKVAPGGLVVIEKLPTQQEIAIMVNTSRETVSRALHTLIDKGIVEKDLRRLIVREPEALRKAVMDDLNS